MKRPLLTVPSGLGTAPVALAVIAALLLTGCLPIWQAREMEEDLQQMEVRQAELEEEAQQRERELAEMIEEAQAEIDELEDVLEEARNILQRDSAELGADVAQSRQELSQLRGQLETLEFQHRRLEQALDTFRDDMDTRFADTEPDRLLEKAEEFQEDGEYHLARRALEQFLTDHEDHELVSEARLELGEVYFESEMWESAVNVFRDLRDDTSSTTRQARATRRIGEVFLNLGDCDNAELFFEAVVADYPNSAEVSEAREFLDQIQRGDCPPS